VQDQARRVGARVLVVDDDDGVGAMLVDLLALEGYQVDAACDGAEAMACIAAAPPDLVMCDVWMPKRNGLAVAT
jgi:two-component system response regulator HydG